MKKQNAKLFDSVNYNHLTENELSSKGCVDLYTIFCLEKNRGLEDTEIGLIARDLKLTGYNSITLDATVRGQIQRWNSRCPEPKINPRVIAKDGIRGVCKQKFYLSPSFSQHVFGTPTCTRDDEVSMFFKKLENDEFFSTIDFGTPVNSCPKESFLTPTQPSFLDLPFEIETVPDFSFELEPEFSNFFNFT